MFRLIFFIALIFSPFAAAIAFAITYTEYSRHFVEGTVLLSPGFPALLRKGGIVLFSPGKVRFSRGPTFVKLASKKSLTRSVFHVK